MTTRQRSKYDAERAVANLRRRVEQVSEFSQLLLQAARDGRRELLFDFLDALPPDTNLCLDQDDRVLLKYVLGNLLPPRRGHPPGAMYEASARVAEQVRRLKEQYRKEHHGQRHVPKAKETSMIEQAIERLPPERTSQVDIETVRDYVRHPGRLRRKRADARERGPDW